MQGFLNHHFWHVVFPDCTASRLSAFAHYDVARSEAVAFLLVLLESHLAKSCQIELTPSHIEICKVGKWFSAILFLVQHLAETKISNII